MKSGKRHAEIAGAGFGGLIAAIALAERGWSVRVHEKTPAIRAEGFAISMQPNMLRVLETLGLHEDVISGGMLTVRRETRDGRGQLTMEIRGHGAYRVSRQHIVEVLARRAAQLGVELAPESPVTGAEPDGTLRLADGRGLKADAVIGADGAYSAVRDSLGLLAKRVLNVDGAMRMMIARSPEEIREEDRLGALTCERWSGARRIITSTASTREVYVAMSCLAKDAPGRAMPIDAAAWTASFPQIADVFERIAREADWNRVRWTQFQIIRLKQWHAGRVAVLGDAAHAMSPNLAQGAGCAMMNALALAVALDESADVEDAYRRWEQRERPLTEHTQRWSRIYGSFTLWPEQLRSLAFNALGNVKWLRSRYQRTANHIPTGYKPIAARRGP